LQITFAVTCYYLVGYGFFNIFNLIAVDILLPQLLKSTGLKQEDFMTRELKELIIPSLLSAAERLKVLISENIALQSTSISLKELSNSDEVISILKPVDIETKKGRLFLEEPKLSFKEFADINALFTVEKAHSNSNRIEGELEFISIFTPIHSALKKANLTPNDIDYVLFIGGSSKNPFIQSAVSNYFPESEKLIPKDLQAHVSAGAALHSLVYNGYGKNIIQPITSEPILLITKDGYMEKVESIIEAGTVIPTELKFIDNLSPQREGQDSIEFPICIGNKNKILYNIKVFNSEGNNFKLSDKIKLEFEINADKLLLIKASVADKRIMVEPLSPFSNKELTTEERIRQKAEKEFNTVIGKNGGEPTFESLNSLHKAYEKVGLEFKAAETLELISEIFPSKANLNNIGIHYSNAGKNDKALLFYERAMEQSPSSTTAFNLAMQYKQTNKTKYKKYIEQAYRLNPQSNTACYNYGQELINEGEIEKGNKLLQDAFDRWQKKFDTNQMEKWDYSWFASCARALGKNDYAQHIEDSKPKENYDLIYNTENLTQIRQEKGLQKQ
jgi:tetratricopeptide (TPR) repeat protein